MDRLIYYVDPQQGEDSNGGLSPEQPTKTIENRKFIAGDTILFKRGSVIRGALHTCDGSATGSITYGAYGKGSKPVFLGSVPADEQEQWVEDFPSVWRYTRTFESEVCNIVFNGGESCGNLRWNISSLKQQGEWYYTGIGQSAEGEQPRTSGEFLYLFSACNPGLFYQSIECALWGERKLVGGNHHIILENIAFHNAGVHGFQEIYASNITIRHCEFRFIGGAVWSRDRQIRFGNAIEFWNDAKNIKVENCIFDNIYDSGITHQGEELSGTPEHLFFRNNLFLRCGMAAYECRGPAAQEVYFENNTCINAGGGFCMQGEAPPRQSEIYPQPMGHHIFIWRIDKGTQKGQIYIRNNIFYKADFGAAIYSIIDPEDEQRLVIDHNCYVQAMENMLVRMNGRCYSFEQFPLYQAETGKDSYSVFSDPLFIHADTGNFNLREDSPCKNMGIDWKITALNPAEDSHPF